jgi:Beta-lactamase class C and other penicillin binding proteins
MYKQYWIFLVFIVGFTSFTIGQELKPKAVYYPGPQWEVVDRPEVLGLSSAGLAKAKEYAGTINTAAVMVVVDGKVAYQWGDVDKKFNAHSIRKSFLSAIYGKYVQAGLIDLDATMADLGIDDVEGLSEEELKATVRDCLKARSGVYHPALYESAGMKRLKPARHSEKAGTHWYYNNWDFNVLGTIFEQQTKQKIFETIESDIAKPIGMQDYTAADGSYVSGEESKHNAYPFRVTARDLARFGWLMLNHGKWLDKQVIDSAWVEESTRYHSDAALYSSSGYGYLWWVARDFNKYPHLQHVHVPEGSYSARGSGGHLVVVIPDFNMVVVHRVNTDIRGNSVSYEDFGRLLGLILDARM